MAVFLHDSLPVHRVPRIQTRILVGEGSGAAATAIWEQWIETGGYIPLHYHEGEEVLVILSGSVDVTLGEEQVTVPAPATIVVPAHQIHGLRPTGSEQVHLLAMFPEKSPQIFDPQGTLRPLPWEDWQQDET